jgi:F0F1-type ATP synthase assembly protein I
LPWLVGLERLGLAVSRAPPRKRESCVALKPESRSAVTVATEWASRVTTIALGFSLPAFIGYGLDLWLGSTPIATLVGIVLGFVSGLLQTIRLASNLPGAKPPRPGRFHQEPKTTLSPEEKTDIEVHDFPGNAAQ